MNYHNITSDDMLNGDGLRVVLWVSGCSHACKNCHNPITWDAASGLLFDEEAENELFAKLGKSYISGITFSGGDPLYMGNRSEISRLVKKVKEKFPKKTIWLYTGYMYEEICDLDFIPLVDVIVDGKFEEDKKDAKLQWKGSSNQRVIDVCATLSSSEVVLHKISEVK